MSVAKWEYDVLVGNDGTYSVIVRNAYGDNPAWSIYAIAPAPSVAREIADALNAAEVNR